MAKDIKVTVNDKQVQKLMLALNHSAKNIGRVMFRAIDKTTKKSRTDIVNEIVKEISTPKKVIRDAIKYDKPSYRHWMATLDMFMGRIPLIKFSARQTAKGVSYRIKKSGPREKIPHAFIATMSSGHKGVFRRVGDDDDMVDRLPIQELRGPSVGHLFENVGKIARRVQSDTTKRLDKNIDIQLELMLKKLKKVA